MSRRGENIYKRKDGRWEGRYVKGRKADGKLQYGYIYRKSYKEVQTSLMVLKSQQQVIQTQYGTYTGTCRHWFQTWLQQEIKEHVKLSTFASYQHKLQTYILPTIQDIPLNQLTSEALQALIDQWKEQLSVNTIRVLYRILDKGLRTAVISGNLLANPCNGVILPKKQPSTICALSLAEQRRLEQAAQIDIQGLPALLALYTGLRMGELAALQWQHIDFEAQLIRVSHTYQRLPLANDQGKTQLVYSPAKTTTSVRTVPFSSKVKRWLLSWQKTQSSVYVFSKKGKPMEPRLLTYHFHKLVNKADLGTIHFHQLRHTFATRCMEAKGDVAAISAMLGHASAKTTLDVYTDALLDQRRAVITAMEMVV